MRCFRISLLKLPTNLFLFRSQMLMLSLPRKSERISFNLAELNTDVSTLPFSSLYWINHQENICRNLAGQEINVNMTERFPAQITQEDLESAIRFERSELKLLIPDLEKKVGLAVVQISQDAIICILKYSGIGKDELPVNVFN